MLALFLLLACGDPVTYVPPTTTDTDSAVTLEGGPLEAQWCEPNPCGDADRGVCRVQDDAVVCLCDDGFHETVDGACEPAVCLPSPCDVAGGTDCVADGDAASCDCEVGLERDTWGRCVESVQACADPQANPASVIETDGYAVHLAPIVGDDGRVFVPQLGRALVALAVDGSAVWSPRYDYTASSPLALGPSGEVFTSDADGVLRVIHPDDGRDWWTWPLAGPVPSRAAVASDGVVYVGDSTGVLTALRAAQELWTREFRAATDVRPAVGPDDQAYAVAIVSQDGAWESVLYRLDPASGDVDWKYDDGGLGLAVGSPAVTSDGVVLIAADSVLAAIDADGVPAWTVDLPAPAGSGPVLDGSGGVYLLAGSQLCRIEAQALAWCLADVVALTEPAVAQQRHAVFGGEGSTLHLVSPAGERVWTMALDGALTAAAAGPQGELRLGSSAGLVYSVAFCGACEQTWCDGDALMGCREDGQGMALLEDCAVGGNTCSDGACRVSSYQAQAWRACGDDGPVWFDSDGVEGAAIEVCGDDELCDQGACVRCWGAQSVGCSDDLTVSVLDECGNLESVVETCDAATEGCVESRCVTCTEKADTVCQDDQPYWVDACGAVGVQADTCEGTETCVDGDCVACASHAGTVCEGGDAWWVDACDNVEDLAETCGFYDECVDGVCVEDCRFESCSTASFVYTCPSSIESYACEYDGPGPNGLSACVTTYDNGHSVTCSWTSETAGSCVDDGGVSCGF